MDTLSYKTVSVGKTAAQKEWVIVDATDQVLGRLASKVAKILRGKYKPCFTPNADCGDNVIIINADKVKLTGNKWSDKIYLTYTGYPGGQREITPAKLMQKGESKLFLKVCCQKTDLEHNFFVTYTFMPEASTHTLHNNLKQLI